MRLTSAAAATGGGAHPLRSGFFFACREEFESPARGLAVCLPGSSCQPRLASPDRSAEPTLVTLATPVSRPTEPLCNRFSPLSARANRSVRPTCARLAEPAARFVTNSSTDNRGARSFCRSCSVVRSVRSVAPRRSRSIRLGSKTTEPRARGLSAPQRRRARRRTVGTANDGQDPGTNPRTGCVPAAPAGIIVRPRTVARLSWAHHISSERWAGNGFRPWKISRAWTNST